MILPSASQRSSNNESIGCPLVQKLLIVHVVTVASRTLAPGSSSTASALALVIVARAALAGFDVIVVARPLPAGDSNDGLVLTQSLTPGTDVPPGTVISLEVGEAEAAPPATTAAPAPPPAPTTTRPVVTTTTAAPATTTAIPTIAVPGP